MQVVHQLPSQPKLVTDYNLEEHSLTRVIDSTIHTIYLKNKTSISDLARLSKLPDEEFKLMAYLQRKKD